MLSGAKLNLAKQPNSDELKQGQRVRQNVLCKYLFHIKLLQVEIIGKLAVFNGLKHIYVNYIKKKHDQPKEEYVKELKACYETYEQTKHLQ